MGLYVPHRNPGTTGVMGFRGPKHDENGERRSPAQGSAHGEELGGPKALVCAYPSECESGYDGCQVRHYLLVNAPISGWLTCWILTIELSGVVGGVAIVDEPNPRGLFVSVFLTKTRSVAAGKAESMLVVDQALVEHK